MSSLDRRCVRRLCRDPAPKKEKNTRHCSKETYIDCIIVFSATSRKADVVYGHPTSGIPCNGYMKPYYWGMIVTMAHLCSSARCYSAGAGKPSRHHQRWLHGVALRLLQHHQSDLKLWKWVWNLEANACCRSCVQIGASCSFQHVAKCGMMWVSRFFLAAFAEAELEALQAQGYGFPDPCWTLLVRAHIETLWIYKRFQVDYCSLILKVQTLHEVLHMGQHRSGKLCALIETEDKVPPFPSSEAMSIIREELGQDFSPILAAFRTGLLLNYVSNLM